MRRLPHGYSNDTMGDGTVVVKRYRGPDADVRRDLERDVLERLQGLLPVPPLRDRSGDRPRIQVTLGFVQGAHGQDLLDAGMAAECMQASGRVLARIHRLVVAEVLPGSPAVAGDVLVHGDFGPNNLLFDLRTSEVVAVLDWEWAHVGRRVEDLAWCEWIVRMHHPKQVSALDGFYAAYGARPDWAERHAAMLARCQELVRVSESRVPRGDGVRLWQARAAVTAGWVE